jgi:hypothetical protein
LVKHERLARYRRCVCQGASGGQGSRPGFGRHAIGAVFESPWRRSPSRRTASEPASGDANIVVRPRAFA